MILGVWWRFWLGKTCFFWAKIWTKLEQFLLRQQNPKFKIFRPSLRSGRFFKVKKSFKAKGKPIPPLSSPEIDPNGSILAQNLMPRRPPKIVQNPKFSTWGGSEDFSKKYDFGCMMTFLLREGWLFWAKIWTKLEQFLLRQTSSKFKKFCPSLRSGRIF